MIVRMLIDHESLNYRLVHYRSSFIIMKLGTNGAMEEITVYSVLSEDLIF